MRTLRAQCHVMLEQTLSGFLMRLSVQVNVTYFSFFLLVSLWKEYSSDRNAILWYFLRLYNNTCVRTICCIIKQLLLAQSRQKFPPYIREGTVVFQYSILLASSHSYGHFISSQAVLDSCYYVQVGCLPPNQAVMSFSFL